MGFFNHHQHIVFPVVSGAVVSVFSEDAQRFLGTGFFFSCDSEVVTAWHIVEGLQRISVFLGFPGHGATRHDVMDVVYSDNADLDVAVLRGSMKPNCFLLPTGSFYTGDIGYVFGFDTDHLLKMSAGIITFTGEQAFGKV
jgi:S1-C subfamily serine protease